MIMNRYSCAVLVLTLVLSACSAQTVKEEVSHAVRTGSGLLKDLPAQAAATIELGKMGLQKAQSATKDVKQKVDEVKEGIETVQKGKAMIEEGMGRMVDE